MWGASCTTSHRVLASHTDHAGLSIDHQSVSVRCPTSNMTARRRAAPRRVASVYCLLFSIFVWEELPTWAALHSCDYIFD